jgi:hypothetical protein
LYLLQSASSSDKIVVDFQMDSNRISNRVTDSNQNDFLNLEKQKMQRIDDDRFRREVEAMRDVKWLQVLQDSYRNRGMVI